MQAVHVTADLGADIGVHHRGGDALELAVLAQDVVGERKVNGGHARADHLTCDALVLRIGIRVKKADRDRFDPLGRKRAASLGHAVAVEWDVHGAGA